MADAVVIGAGPNGLVAANLLADAGWDVVLCEATDHIGGAVRSAELIEPGYVNDVFSAFYPLAAASPVIASLQLERNGLRWCRSDVALTHVSDPDGPSASIARTVDDTADAFDKDTAGDGDAWRALLRQWERVGTGLLGTLFSPMPPVRAALKIGRTFRFRPADLVRFTRFALLPAARMGEEEFGSDLPTRLIAGTALHADLSPEATLSGFFGWILCSLAQTVGFPVPEGGAGRLTEAMADRFTAAGGSIRTGAPVVKIVVRRGRATAVVTADGTEIDARKAVVADVSAPVLYLELVPAADLPPALVADMKRRFHWDHATAKVDWNLDAPIPWVADPATRSGTVHVGGDVDDLVLGAAQLATGRIPARPFLVMGQQSPADATRAPAGKETAWAYTHVPQQVKGDLGGDLKGTWDAAEANTFADRIEGEIERLAPGFRSLIRGRHILTPPDMEAENPSLIGGAINAGTAQLHQQLVFRPVPGLGRAETPIAGLYLASGSAHPGGGVHGACGSNAARAALRRVRLPRR